MRHLSIHLCLGMLVWASTGTLQAQGVYRCGDSYSQTPCNGGSSVQVNDARSADQKAQTDAAARQQLRAADNMEKARQRQEANPVNSYIAPEPKAAASTPATTKKVVTHKHHKGRRGYTEPEYFTAKVPEAPRAAKEGKPPAKHKPAATGH